MNRRNFLKFLGGAAATAVVTPDGEIVAANVDEYGAKLVRRLYPDAEIRRS